MNYENSRLREMLAAEYALGTLTGAARRRFERLLVDDALLRAELMKWETHLVEWGGTMPSQAPPARIWRRIEKELRRNGPRSVWSSAGFWQACAGLAAAVLIAVVAWWQLRPPLPAALATTIVTTQAGEPVWVISAQPRTSDVLTIFVVGPAEPPAGMVYELWMLPGDGAAPVSLGVLPQTGVAMRQLTAAQLQVLGGTEGVAVSIEPPGGSPTGQPTGDVVYTAPLTQA